jgi:hypothetical protein
MTLKQDESQNGLLPPQYMQLNCTQNFVIITECHLHRWCLHPIVVVGFECFRDPESYAGGSIATGRVTHAEQVKV